MDGEGLNPDDVLEFKKRNGTVVGYPGEFVSNEELLELRVDLLIPAAIENVINESNMRNIKAKLIVEGANGPITPEAEEYLNRKCELVVPDILANSGGVVVSYFEWVQDLERYFWDLERVNTELERILVRAFRELISVKNEYGDILWRDAAMVVALERVVEALKRRGIFP